MVFGQYPIHLQRQFGVRQYCTTTTVHHWHLTIEDPDSVWLQIQKISSSWLNVVITQYSIPMKIIIDISNGKDEYNSLKSLYWNIYDNLKR